MRRLSFAFLLLISAPVAVHAEKDRVRRAERLYRRAQIAETRNSLESRQQARVALEEATLLDPDRPEYQLALGRLYFRMGFLKLAKDRFQRVQADQPENADSRIGLGLIWRRDYLKYLDRGSLDESIHEFSEAARLRPESCEAWLNLVCLLVEKQNLRAALAAAEHARESDQTRPEALLAVAHVSYRIGDVARADSAFRSALPRLPRIVRERFDDIAPVASERDTAVYRRLPAAQRGEFLRRFWKEHDPDLATPENEAQLEYWSRVTQAYFLFFDTRRRQWDERGEIYVRYGPPSRTEYNPVNARLNTTRSGSTPGVTIVNGNFPANVLVWDYPNLGMTITLQDRLLSETYMLPITMDHDPDPIPDPDSLAQHPEELAARSGRAVFPMLPPGTRSLPVQGVLARFEGAGNPRLLSLLEAPGGPADSLWAEWVVLDSTDHEVARESRALSPSACDAATLRVADFASELPPGTYLAGVSVHGRDGGRGVFRSPIVLTRTPSELELSDVVVSCGSPQVERGVGDRPPAVRLSANPGGIVTGADPLTVYFEMYHLTPGRDGRSRVEFEYTVRSGERDARFWLQRFLAPRRALPDISARRREEQVGDLRRQFVTVPVQALPGGRYRLEVRVRDLNAGTEAVKTADFVKRAG